MEEQNKMRRLYFDIETSPDIAFVWRCGYNLTVSHDSIIEERKIICICWKWEGDKKVHSLNWDSGQNDKSMLAEFIKVANEADEIVGHFVDGFDMPWVRTRCLFHDLDAFPSYKTIDTKALASKNFYFNSNKLDYIAKFLGFGGKIETRYQMWIDITLNNDRRVLADMVKYCKKDVVLLEKVWKKLSLVTPHKTHVGVMKGQGKWTCPRDGSKHVKASKRIITAAGSVKHQMQCKTCGGYFTINAATYIAYELVSSVRKSAKRERV